MRGHAWWLVLGLALAACGDDAPSDEGGAGAAAVGAGGSSGGGAAGRAGAPASGGDAMLCSNQCSKATAACGDDRASCLEECNGLLSVAACSSQVRASLACQSSASGACNDEGDYEVNGCESESTAAASCVLAQGGPPTAGAGVDARREPIPSSEAVDMIVAACGTLCRICPAEDCMDDCRVSGARHLDCVGEYLDVLRCTSTNRQCSREGPCQARYDALRACWWPAPETGTFDCKAACDARLKPNCPGDNDHDVCLELCANAESMPACSTLLSDYTRCASSSRDVCLPATGQVFTECTDESLALARCATPPDPFAVCYDCFVPKLGSAGTCLNILNGCNPGFDEACYAELECFKSCVLPLTPDATPRTYKSCAARCTGGTGDPDDSRYHRALGCAVCACPEACQLLEIPWCATFEP